MFILLIQYYPDPNPCYQVLASNLRSQGHTVWLGTRQNGDLKWLDESESISILPGPRHVAAFGASRTRFSSIAKRIEFFKFILRIRRFIGDHQPDVVQVNSSNLYWTWALPLLMPQVIHFVIDFRQLGQRADTGLLANLKNAWTNWQRAICCKYIYDGACFQHKLGAEKILGEGWSRWAFVVPVGVDESFIIGNYPRRKDSNNNYPVRFIYVGVISRVRQLENVLEAARRVLQVTEKFRLLFIGTDAAQGYYRQMIQELGLASVADVKPPVDYYQVPGVLAENDVGLAITPDRPPDWHYYPTLKVLEYRALGMPILASDNAPNREIIENRINGLLVQNNPEDIAKGMLDFIENHDLLEECKENALLMRQGLRWSEVARMYERTYQAILKCGRRGIYSGSKWVGGPSGRLD